MTPITRRAFLATGTAAFATIAMGATKREKRPNVLLILTDEQSLWTLGAYGGKLPGTPNIDSIGKEGAIFRNFFVTSAVCTPSRGCLLTGRYPNAHGAVQESGIWTGRITRPIPTGYLTNDLSDLKITSGCSIRGTGSVLKSIPRVGLITYLRQRFRIQPFPLCALSRFLRNLMGGRMKVT
jgi:hypothetical protein